MSSRPRLIFSESLQSIGFGATLPQRRRESKTEDEIAETTHNGSSSMKKDRLTGLSTADLVEYGFIPESVVLVRCEQSPGLPHLEQIRRPFTYSGTAPLLIALGPRAHSGRAKECSRQAIPQALCPVRLRVAVYRESVVRRCGRSFQEGRQCTSSA